MAMRTRHSFTAGILGGLVLLAGGVMAQVPSSRIPVAPPRWISNDVKPVYRYAISDGGTSVVLLRSDDTSVVTIEPESGEELLHLRGSRAPHALAVSPDGLRCMVTEFTGTIPRKRHGCTISSTDSSFGNGRKRPAS